MTYKINKTDGSLLTEIIDSAIDQTATDITLIGKNVTGYGEYINENFVKILENFASTNAPSNPITGQIWFDLSENRLKVYDGNGFRIGSGPIVSGVPPINPNQGDFWIDSQENQLYFYDGTDRVLAGPIYKDSQGISGFEVETISDVNGNPKVITKLWSAGTLLGIYSSNPEFQPGTNIGGYAAGTTIKPGFNVGLVNNFKINATATAADALVDAQGNLKTVSNFMITNGNNSTNGRIIINNPNPLTLGVSQETDVTVSSSVFQIRSNENGQDIKLTTRIGGFWSDGLTLKATTNRAGIYNPNPQAMLHVGTAVAPGSVIIEGDLTVKGATTTINSTNLSIQDKLIELAKTASPSDTIADGGGFVLKGTTDHSITWVDANDSWLSTESFELANGRSFRIDGVDVLTKTTLGATVTSAPGITSFGTLENLQVDDVNINGNVIKSTSTTDPNLYLAPSSNFTGVGTPTVHLGESSSSIPVILRNVSSPSGATDAANKQYVDELLTKPWTEINQADSPYLASRDERLFVSTISNPVTVILPQYPFEGDSIRFLDFDSEFDTNNLTIKRYRNVDPSSIYGISSTAGNYNNRSALSITGTGTGVIFDIEITQSNAVYNNLNTGFTVVEHGDLYKDGDTLRIPGNLLGGDVSSEVIRAETIPQVPHEIFPGQTVLTFKKSEYPTLTPAKIGWKISGTGIVSGTAPFNPETTTISNIAEVTIPDPTPTKQIAFVERNVSGIVTITTATEHNFLTGDLVTVNCISDSDFNIVDAVINVTGLTTFTYSQAGLGLPTVPQTVATGTVTVPAPNIQVWKVTIPRELNVFQGTYVISDGNDLIFDLYLYSLLGLNEDLIVNTQNAAFGLIYLNPAQGWRYTEVSDPPAQITADLLGNVEGNIISSNTGNVVLDTTGGTALYTGNVQGNVTGNVQGNVTGNLNGFILTNSQPNITSLGVLNSLTVAGTINGNLNGTVTGSLVGNMTGSTITGPSLLTIQSQLNAINIKSGFGGIRVSAVDNTGAQEQYVMQITAGTSPGLRSSTTLYGDVVVSNQTTSFTNGGSFRLPQYTTVQRDARSLSFLNYGELIYNTDTNTIQGYVKDAVSPGVDGWVDLH